MTADREELRQGTQRILLDEQAHAARESFCRTAAQGFASVGQALYVGGWIQRDDRAGGLAYVAQIGGELGQASIVLMEAGHYYAASALHRQIVEVEYLLWCFADSPDDAARWKRATPAQINRHFTPSTMRKRAGAHFRHSEYRSHCNIGGHPNPQAAPMLRGHAQVFTENRHLWVDLGQHLERGWGFLLNALEEQDWRKPLAKSIDPVDRSRTAWHERDLLAGRLPPAVLPDKGP